jgi:hypothetical protein
MLPNLAVSAAALGLLFIIFLVYREQRNDTAPAERRMLVAVALVTLTVAAVHVLQSGGGAAH